MPAQQTTPAITQDQYAWLMKVRFKLRNSRDPYLIAIEETVTDRNLLRLAELIKAE